MNKLYEKALALACKAHAGQKYGPDEDYINHPIRVANAFLSNDELRSAAVLHDVVEDSEVTLDDIEQAFGKRMREILDALTHRKHESYRDYLLRCAKDSDALTVKMEDVRQNLFASKAKPEYRKFIKKYEGALELLSSLKP